MVGKWGRAPEGGVNPLGLATLSEGGRRGRMFTTAPPLQRCRRGGEPPTVVWLQAPPPWQIRHTVGQFSATSQERRPRGAMTRYDVGMGNFEPFWTNGGTKGNTAPSSRCGHAPRAAAVEMTSEPQEIGSGKNLAARLPEVDFAVVLSRFIESVEHNPAQLRNAVYELARIELQREVCRRDPPIEARRLTLALESAIEGVETVYAKQDELRALRSLHQLIESSGFGQSEVMKPREPLLFVEQLLAPTGHGTRRIPENRIAASNPNRLRQSVRKSPVPRMRVIARGGASLNFGRLLRRPLSAPLVRGAMVVIFAVALCAVVSGFGLLRHQAAPSSPSQPVGQLRQQAAVSSRSQSEPAPATSTIAQIQDAPANSHRRLADAGAPGIGYVPSYGGRDLQAAPDEQPVKPPGALPTRCTQAYKVPSESGGIVSINVVRC
jgi:hypothetical protein